MVSKLNEMECDIYINLSIYSNDLSMETHNSLNKTGVYGFILFPS